MDGNGYIGAVPAQDLVACPQCDALYRVGVVPPGQRARCSRCHTVLLSPRRRAGMTILSLALAAVVLLVGALWFPFLRISTAASGRRRP